MTLDEKLLDKFLRSVSKSNYKIIELMKDQVDTEQATLADFNSLTVELNIPPITEKRQMDDVLKVLYYDKKKKKAMERLS